jgi:SET domain-containing protein
MLWNIKVENLISGDFVEFIKDGDGNLSCKKALELGSITAVAARDIAEGELLTFDMNGDTKDLTTPQKATS